MSGRNHSDFIEGYLEFTKNQESNERVHLWTAIATVAATLERRVWIDFAHYQTYPNLYTIIVGKSGLVKKSTSTGIGVKLLEELETLKICRGQMTPVGLLSEMQENGKHFDFEGERYYQSPIFLYASEFAVMMEEIKGSLAINLTDMGDCPGIFERKVMSNPFKILGPCINLLGCSTKAWLQKCIPAADQEGGFSSRCVFVVEDKAPERIIAIPKKMKDYEKKKSLLVQDLREIFDITGEYKMTEKTEAMFTEWYNYYTREIIAKNNDPRFQGYHSRKGNIILKVSMVKSACRHSELLIRSEDFLWAMDKVDDLEIDMFKAFRENSGNPLSKLMYEIIEVINKVGTIYIGDLKKKLRDRYLGSDVYTAVMELVEQGEILGKREGSNFKIMNKELDF